MFLFILNSISNPAPDPTNRPAINDPKFIIPDRYNSVIITEEAQFGIKPINDAITGSKIELSDIKFFNVSSPKIVTIILIIRVKINIYINTFIVCFNAVAMFFFA